MRCIVNRPIVLSMIMILMILINGSSVFGATGEPDREELVDIYNRARMAVVNQDLKAFVQLVVPADPDAEMITKEELADVKDFVDFIFPDLSGAVFHRVTGNSEEALFVVQTDPENNETIELNAFRFLNKGGHWMLVAESNGKSFSKESREADEEQIRRILEYNPSFRLLSEGQKTAEGEEAAESPQAKAGDTGSGFLTLAQQTYNFKYAFAYRKKAYGQEDKINIHVVLTEEPVSVGAIRAQLREEDDWSEFVNHLTLVFDPELQPDFMHFWVKHNSISYSGSPFHTNGRAELVGERIKGSLKMKKPKPLFDDSFLFNVAFNAEIISK